MKIDESIRADQFEGLQKELFYTREKLADVGETLSETIKLLHNFQQDYALLMEVWETAHDYCFQEKTPDRLEKLVVAITKYQERKII